MNNYTIIGSLSIHALVLSDGYLTALAAVVCQVRFQFDLRFRDFLTGLIDVAAHAIVLALGNSRACGFQSIECYTELICCLLISIDKAHVLTTYAHTPGR